MGDALVVGQLNVGSLIEPNWAERRHEVVAWLDRLDADVVCLQEVWEADGSENTAGWIAAQRPGRWSWCFGGHPIPGAFGLDPSLRFGSAVLSRWPIDRHELFTLPGADPASENPYDRIQLELLAARTRGVDVFSTHLFPMPHRATIRRAQARFVDEVVASWHDPTGPLPPILCGDFNAEPDSDEIRFLCGLTSIDGRDTWWQEAWRAAGRTDAGITQDPANPNYAVFNLPPKRIDYVFVGDTWPTKAAAERAGDPQADRSRARPQRRPRLPHPADRRACQRSLRPRRHDRLARPGPAGVTTRRGWTLVVGALTIAACGGPSVVSSADVDRAEARWASAEPDTYLWRVEGMVDDMPVLDEVIVADGEALPLDGGAGDNPRELFAMMRDAIEDGEEVRATFHDEGYPVEVEIGDSVDVRTRELRTVEPPAGCAGADAGSPTDLTSEPAAWPLFADYTRWTDSVGCPVRIDVVAQTPGADHCDWGDVTFLTLGDPIGATIVGADGSVVDAHRYVWDPGDDLGGIDDVRRDERVAVDRLAPTVADTGFRRDGAQLWADPGDRSAVYVVESGSADRYVLDDAGRFVCA